jgi:hypothetical protein
MGYPQADELHPLHSMYLIIEITNNSNAKVHFFPNRVASVPKSSKQAYTHSSFAYSTLTASISLKFLIAVHARDPPIIFIMPRLFHRLEFLCPLLLLPLLLSGKSAVQIDLEEARPVIQLDHLLGTNLALWHEPSDIAKPGFRNYLEDWAPGLIRLPGGSWSNEYFWNGHGVRTGPQTFNHEAFQNGAWQIDYSDYAPGFRVHGTGRELSDYHGVLDVRFQHELAESFGADQMVTVNVGTGTPEMAVEWLQWTRKEGYSVPYWEIGNELNGQWETGHFLPDGRHMTGELYAQRFLEYAKALKEVDPAAKTGGPASSDLSLAFVEELIRDAGDLLDFVSFHAYPVGVQRSDVLAQFEDIQLLRDALTQIRQWKKRYQPERYSEIEIGITEWNMKVNEDRDTADLVNTLWSCAWIGAMMEGEVTLSNQWDLFTRTAEGGHGAFYPEADRVIPTGIYWAQYLWSHHMGNRFIPLEKASVPDDLEVFATLSSKGLHLMTINPSREKSVPFQFTLPSGHSWEPNARLATLSHREYFWNPHAHRPEWSHPPCLQTVPLKKTLSVEIPPFSVRVIEIPFEGNAMAAGKSVEESDPVSLRLILPDEAPSDLPLEGWVVAWNEKKDRPHLNPPNRVQIKLKQGNRTEQIDLQLSRSVGSFFWRGSGPGILSITASSGRKSIQKAVTLTAVESRPRILWTFDNPIGEWGVQSTFGVGMEPSVKPNEFVAEAILEKSMPAANADILLQFSEFPDDLPKERIGGLVLEIQTDPTTRFEDDEALVNIVLQSEADHWMPLAAIPLKEMRGHWKHLEIPITDPRRLKAMARLYSVRFVLQSESPVTGNIYFDNIGFLLRGQ